jgi:hypothetical protein
MNSRMDQAWQLERELWEATTSGEAAAFYTRHMTTDGYVVLPTGIVDRLELISRWGDKPAMTNVELSEPRMGLVDGESVLISYGVTAHSEWLPNYQAHITALYTWSGGEWALAFRQHTPVGEHAFPF